MGPSANAIYVYNTGLSKADDVAILDMTGNINDLFVWFDSLCPINNLSVKQGRVFLGWTS